MCVPIYLTTLWYGKDGVRQSIVIKVESPVMKPVRLLC